MTGLVSPVDTRRKNVDVSQDALGTDHLDAVVMPIGIIDPVSINDARNVTRDRLDNVCQWQSSTPRKRTETTRHLPDRHDTAHVLGELLPHPCAVLRAEHHDSRSVRNHPPRHLAGFVTPEGQTEFCSSSRHSRIHGPSLHGTNPGRGHTRVGMIPHTCSQRRCSECRPADVPRTDEQERRPRHLVPDGSSSEPTWRIAHPHLPWASTTIPGMNSTVPGQTARWLATSSSSP